MRFPGWMKIAAALALCAAAGGSRELDCESPASVGDPYCRAPADALDRPERAEVPASGIPVIRDPGAPRSEPAEARRARGGSRDAMETQPGRRPPAPTEFQRFVEQSTGKMLPIFGADLFRDVPSTFAPVESVPVTPDYPVGPGDQLLIRGWGQIDLRVSPVVDRNGAIYIPQVGEVRVAGLSFSQVQDSVKSAIGRVYRNFDLSVGMGQLRSIQVYVMGHARRPGAYTVSSLSTLVNALFASGGPDSSGSMRAIRLRRGGRHIGEFDLYDLLVRGDKSGDRVLLPGDVIHIPPVGPQVALTGSLNTPAIYEIRAGATLEDALQLAGGLTPVAATGNVFIERIGNASRRVIRVSLGAEHPGGTRLENGDIVSILPIVPRFENTVTLRGNVADPIRVPWRPGMKILDLIPDARVLLGRDYWLARNRLAPRERRSLPPDAPEVNGEPAGESGSNVKLASLMYPGRAPVGVVAPQARAAPRAIGAPDQEPLLPKNRPERSPLEINWSYAVVERLNPLDLRTRLIPFRLGKAVIERDESENLPLEPGDMVTVFSTSDLKVPQRLQTRYVRLEGEFESAGVYSVQPGQTLRQLVTRAGGLTPQAYLFGSEFLRESSRADQQQRLDDLVNSLERQVAASSANVFGTIVSPERTAAAVHQVSGQRELVEKLRRIKATGRVVLGLDPHASGVDSLPELPLEDGDVFTVPSSPSFVSVVGSVYNGTSFLYEEEKPAGYYLRKAGGPTRSADRRSIFLIRADGSVIGKSWAGELFGRGLESLPMNPGDTLVVPDAINRTTFLKGLQDWSLVFAQFGLGAAAVNVLR